ncbi:MAG: flagellar motor switch protein FliN [Planctomycetota bacterium]
MADETNPPNPAEAAQDDSVQAALDDAQSSIDEIRDEVDGSAPASASVLPVDPAAEGIQLLNDVELDVTVELGRTEMLVEDVLKLNQGSVVELEKLAGDPVDVFVNGRLVARGEVLVLNDNFCIRVSEIVENLEEQAAAAMGVTPQTIAEPSA